MGRTYTAKIETDGDDPVLVLPDELVRAMGLREGDTILWERDEPATEGEPPVFSCRRIDP